MSFGSIFNISNINTLPKDNTTSLNIVPRSSLICLGQKHQALPFAADVIVYTYTGSGIMKKLWFAITTEPETTFLYITVDGNVTFGNTSTSTEEIGLNTIGLSCDLALGAGRGNTVNFNTTTIGSNNGSNGYIGGFFALDIPFSSSVSINLNNTVTSGLYWIQPFIQTNPSIPISLSSLQLHCDTFKYGPTVYNSEYPLLNCRGNGNGVYLKGVKLYCRGISGHWWESRIRMYSGGTGMNIVQPTATCYTDKTYKYSLPYQTGATVLWTSSGFEDFFLSSDNFAGQATYFANDAGLLYNTAGTKGVGPTDTISVYRFFGVGSEVMPYSSSNLVVTFTSGDPQIGTSGVVDLIGQIYYYM